MKPHRFEGRREDERFTRGLGRYTADLGLASELHASFCRSDRSHARIARVNPEAARKLPGVVTVLTGADIRDWGMRTLPPVMPFPGRGGKRIQVPERPVLALDRVRYVGEEIAVVIAELPSIARDAADLVQVDFEDLRPAIGCEAAVAPDAPRLHAEIPGNVCFEFEYGDRERTARLMANAACVVKARIASPRIAPTTMEPRGALAWYNRVAGRYEIRVANQGSSAMAEALATMLGVAPDRVVVHPVDVGGAFGARTAPYAEYPLLLRLAERLGRPIKWVSTRTEDFLTDNHGRAVQVSGELALDRDGRFLALQTDWLCDSGAYPSQAGALTNSINGRAIGAGCYVVEALYGRHRQVMTNTAPTNAFRGAGRPEAAWIVERLVDEAAVKLGRDALDLRRQNAIQRESMPYTTSTGVVFDSGDFAALVDEARRLSAWDDFAGRRAGAREAGKLRGIGCALFVEPSGGMWAPKDEVAIRFEGDGVVSLYAAPASSGQGHETVFPDLVAAWLGLPAERVALKAGAVDGPKLIGSPAIGSRSAMSQGSVFKLAAAEVVRKGRELAADILEVSAKDIRFRDGRYVVEGTDRTLSMQSIIDDHGHRASALNTISELKPASAFPSGAHIAEVEIDPETGAVDLVRYAAVDDLGSLVNPALAEGQLHGGIAHAVSHVFGEDCSYDAETGQLLTASFMDYSMLRADGIPSIELAHLPVPSPNNALGAKGAGEAGTTGGTPACASAIMSALRNAGVRDFDMPATPARVWHALWNTASKDWR